MTHLEKLLALAKQCEEAKGTEWALRDIDRAIRPLHYAWLRTFGATHEEATIATTDGWHDGGNDAKHYTTSFEDALTLVPNDCAWVVSKLNRHAPVRVTVHNNDEVFCVGSRHSPKYVEVSAATTPPLAMCAASLRACAMQVNQD